MEVMVMPKVKSPTVFVYVPDPNKTLDDNLIEITQHMKQAIGEDAVGPTFRIILESDAPAMDAKEAHDLLEQGMEDAIEIDKIKPHTVDTDGEILYKKTK